jgi:hypothetical protein
MRVSPITVSLLAASVAHTYTVRYWTDNSCLSNGATITAEENQCDTIGSLGTISIQKVPNSNEYTVRNWSDGVCLANGATLTTVCDKCTVLPNGGSIGINC